MLWYQLRIEQCPREKVEFLSEELEDLGAVSVTFTDKNDDPILEPAPGITPLWPEVVIEALFNNEIEAQSAQQSLSKQYPDYAFSASTLEDQDWVRVSMENFQPQKFGDHLWICPTWSTPPEPQAVNLILDPGLAFGTGTHPTTSLCLQWLANSDLAHKKMIDFGCGSGILALAALKLGAESVQAVDIDPQALQATENNAALNSISSSKLHLRAPEQLETEQDLIVANILLTPLMSLGERFHNLLNPAGTLVVSGLLKDQASTLIDTYASMFCHKHTEVMGDWILIEFCRL